jgi:hypothetical protein
VARAAASVVATPTTFTASSEGPATAKTAARRSVQSGAVEPDTDTPGL